MSAQILIPVDNSETTERAVSSFLARHKGFSGPVILLHVLADSLDYRAIPAPQLELVREQSREAGEKLLARFGQRFAEAGFEPELRLEHGDPVTLVRRLDAAGAISLLVMARHGASEARDVLFGSVTNALIHRVTCPMLLY